MKHPSSRQVFEYWNERRGDRVAPERGDIEPGPIRRALSDTFILGRDAEDVYRFRLSGTRSCALFCRELKNENFLHLWADGERDEMSERIALASEECAGFIAGVTGRNQEAATLELEMLLLPLQHRDPRQTRLLGVLAPFVPPYWLGATPLVSMTCGIVRHLGPESGHIVAPRLVPGTENARIRHGLIVYDGGRL